MGEEVEKGLSPAAFAAIGTERVLRRAAEAQVEALRKALEPFANYRGSDQYLASDAPDDGACAAVSFTAGDYRRARAALSAPAEERSLEASRDHAPTLRAALEPFAKAAKVFDGLKSETLVDCDADEPTTYGTKGGMCDLHVSDFRRAAAALASSTPESSEQVEVEDLRKQLADLRSAAQRQESFWCEENRLIEVRAEAAEGALQQADIAVEAAEERSAALANLLSHFQSRGCPDCNGDCGSANPPVASCPMQEASRLLAPTEARSEQPAPQTYQEAVDAYNAVLDPAFEAGQEVFNAGFREGWIFANCCEGGDDYEEAAERFSRSVDGVELGEAWDAHRDAFFKRLPLAALLPLPTPPKA